MQRMTRQRTALADLLDDTPDFRSAQQLHQMLKDAGQNVGLATVYRTVQAMAEAGDVDVLRIEDGEALYRRCARGHHHHLVCRECGKTVELAGEAVERWASRIAHEHDFVDVDHTAELVGTCRECASRIYGGGTRA